MSDTMEKLQDKIQFSSDGELHRLVDKAEAEVERLEARVAEDQRFIQCLIQRNEELSGNEFDWIRCCGSAPKVEEATQQPPPETEGERGEG